MDLSEFKKQINQLNNVTEHYHVDIMDGHYVKNMTLSPWFIENLLKVTDVPIEAHLMVENPEEYVDRLLEIGVDIISIHAEHLDGKAFKICETIQSKGARFGVVLNPETNISAIESYINKIDMITVMTVDPGFAGQKFISEMTEKISKLCEIRTSCDYNYIVQVDGACNKNTYEQIIGAGAEVLVLGSTGLFNLDEDILVAINKMQGELSNY